MSFLAALQKNCDFCALNSLCLSAQKINIATRRHHLKKKEILHLAGTSFRHLYAVQSGALKTYDLDQQTRPIIRGFYFQHEVYGYEGIAAGKYVYSAQALTDSVLCEISYDAFVTLLQSDPALISRALYLMSYQLSRDAYLQLSSAQEKVLAFLRALKNRLPSMGEQLFKLPMPYSDIAEYLGLTTETVSRVLSLFQKQKRISINNKIIQFIDIDQCF